MKLKDLMKQDLETLPMFALPQAFLPISPSISANFKCWRNQGVKNVIFFKERIALSRI